MTSIKPSFIIKGALTFVLPNAMYSRQSGVNRSARYYYSVFLRHLVHLNKATGFVPRNTVAELGPGDSIGLGLCALLTGAERYVGLDVVSFADLSKNIDVLNELILLFQNRASIPDDREFPRVHPVVHDYSFPGHVFDETRFSESLSPTRLDALRAELERGGGERITYVAPWFAQGRINKSSVDWIFPQAVLEHVDDLDGTYKAFSEWLAPNGVLSHQIDFKCHNMSKAWNDHWAAPDWLWRVVRGRRPYLLNREPVSTHRKILSHRGFIELFTKQVTRADGLQRTQLPARYSDLSDDDVKTAGIFIVSRKQ